MDYEQSILLESGTNELSIMELDVAGQSFGINALKIKEVIPFDPNTLTETPDQTESLSGMYLYRDQTIPVIDLAIELGKERKDFTDRTVLLVTEFNKKLNGFIIDQAKRIYRLSWEDIMEPPKYLMRSQPCFTAITSIHNDEILILDLEYIISNIFPDSAIDETHEISGKDRIERRKQKRIMVVEDSVLIKNTMLKILRKAGYEDIIHFSNGKDAFEKVETLFDKGGEKAVFSEIDLIISDIEMPQMDGLTLCKRIKKDLELTDLYIIMFSSLITDQIALKCREVGADGYTSKPEIDKLVELIDKYIILNERV